MRIALLSLCLASCAAAQPASDLLQSAIFAQETAGDLDGAIRIYRQILESAGLPLYAAQAQYRLGICLLRKGDSAGATRALQAVIHNYPENRELVARAREGMPHGGGLLPAPWSQTEVAEYRWTIPNVDDGWSLTRIAPAADRNNLRIQMNFYSPRLYTTMVDVDAGAMRPIHATYHPPSDVERDGTRPSHQATYIGPRRHSGGSDVYEYGEVLYLLRRMPLYAGWTATIPVNAPNRMPVDLNASVTGVETVTVPAGTFQCFKVLLAIDSGQPTPRYIAAGTDLSGARQWLWYARDGARPLVKMQVGAEGTGELTSLRTGEQLGTSSYRDPQGGFSFTVPSGWVYHPRTASSGPATSVDLLDPEFQVVVVISFKSKKTPAANIQDELRMGALQEQTLRPALVTRGTLETGQIGGHPSISWTAERDGPSGKIVRYTTWVQSENTRGSIAAAVPAADFNRFQERFQAIIKSIRMP